MKNILCLLMVICTTSNVHIFSSAYVKINKRESPLIVQQIMPLVEEVGQPFYEYMYTLDFCGLVDTCLHFPYDSTRYLNGNGNWVPIGSDTFNQHYRYIGYGDSLNHLIGDSLFTRDPLGQIIMLRNQGSALTGFTSNSSVEPWSYVYGSSFTGSSMYWLDTSIQAYSGIDIF